MPIVLLGVFPEVAFEETGVEIMKPKSCGRAVAMILTMTLLPSICLCEKGQTIALAAETGSNKNKITRTARVDTEIVFDNRTIKLRSFYQDCPEKFSLVFLYPGDIHNTSFAFDPEVELGLLYISSMRRVRRLGEKELREQVFESDLTWLQLFSETKKFLLSKENSHSFSFLRSRITLKAFYDECITKDHFDIRYLARKYKSWLEDG